MTRVREVKSLTMELAVRCTEPPSLLLRLLLLPPSLFFLEVGVVRCGVALVISDIDQLSANFKHATFFGRSGWRILPSASSLSFTFTASFTASWTFLVVSFAITAFVVVGTPLTRF